MAERGDDPGAPPSAPSTGAGPDGAPDPLAESVLHSAEVWRGGFFQVTRDRVRCPDGHEADREYIRHPGAVMIIAQPDPDHVVLERQWRQPLGRSFIEMPAGKLEAGEDPGECARRELLEETGLRARHWKALGGFHNAIGYSDEIIHVYHATDLIQDQADTDAGEVLEVFTAPVRELERWIAEGRVTDVKTIVGCWWLARMRGS